jgi:predicted transglutaminase-like protease
MCIGPVFRVLFLTKFENLSFDGTNKVCCTYWPILVLIHVMYPTYNMFFNIDYNSAVINTQFMTVAIYITLIVADTVKSTVELYICVVLL